MLDAEGKPLSVREALALINQTLDEALAEQEGDFDADSRWALAWFEQYGFDEGEYGVAETLSKAKNTSVAGMVEAGILDPRPGKVRLLQPDELPVDWDPTDDRPPDGLGDAAPPDPRLEPAAARGAARNSVREARQRQAEIARELAYRLYTLCERKKRAAEALSYNGLVQSLAGDHPTGSRSVRQATAAGDAVRSGIADGHHQSRACRQGPGPR